MSLHGYCPHGWPVVKTLTDSVSGALTNETRPVESCLPCREAVKAGASKTLDIYIQHPYPHEEGQ